MKHPQLIRLYPNSAAAYTNRGNVKMEVHGFESAIADYDTALHLDPNYITAYKNRATAKLFNNQFDEVIRIEPNSARTFVYRGDLKAFRLRIHEARADYQTALELAEQQNNTALKTDIEKKLQQFDNLTSQTHET